MSIDSSLEKKIQASIELLTDIRDRFDPAVLANSLGAEDMVLTDMVCRHTPEIGIFCLDTGRLHDETYKVLDKAMKHYQTRFTVYFPESSDVEQFVHEYGINAFYDSIEMRKACCRIRKVLPLQRALKGKKAWITGLRREQAATRTELPVSERDEANGLQKFNPLADWAVDDVWSYIRHFDVPYNELHDRFFPSIGCAPCTRAIAAGEDIRAGRWWWEDPKSKECGLHVKKSG